MVLYRMDDRRRDTARGQPRPVTVRVSRPHIQFVVPRLTETPKAALKQTNRSSSPANGNQTQKTDKTTNTFTVYTYDAENWLITIEDCTVGNPGGYQDIPRACMRISRQVRRGIRANPALTRGLKWLIFETFATGNGMDWSEIHRAAIPEAERFT
jgi:hypothetical protein